MVIYFSGTGNSKYVADAIADRLGVRAVNSNEVIKRGHRGVFHSERPWVFVFPIYLSTMAEIFLKFLQRSKFYGCKDAYFVGTCAGALGAAPNRCAGLCAEKGLNYRGIYRIPMPQNYIALFTMYEAEECERRQEAALVAADEIAAVIQAGESLESGMVSKAEVLATKLVERMYNGPFTGTKKFYATEACIGCGLCEQGCPLNKITMENGKPKWSGSCSHCMGCINRCPMQAIEYGKKTVGKQRYVCKNYQKK